MLILLLIIVQRLHQRSQKIAGHIAEPNLDRRSLGKILVRDLFDPLRDRPGKGAVYPISPAYQLQKMLLAALIAAIPLIRALVQRFVLHEPIAGDLLQIDDRHALRFGVSLLPRHFPPHVKTWIERIEKRLFAAV